MFAFDQARYLEPSLEKGGNYIEIKPSADWIFNAIRGKEVPTFARLIPVRAHFSRNCVLDKAVADTPQKRNDAQVILNYRGTSDDWWNRNQLSQYPREGSNLQPSASEANVLSS